MSKLANIDRSRTFDRVARQRAKSFVKFEVGFKMPTKARLIQGNENEVTAYEFPEEYAAIGKALKEVLEFEYGGISFEFQYASGLSHNDLSDLISSWISRSGPNTIYDERDGVNWDSTMQEETLKCEGELYEALGMEAAAAFFERLRGARGIVHYPKQGWYSFIAYITAFKRLSGDWDTSIGNSLISMLITLIAITELPPHLKPARVSALFMGDDYLGVYSYEGAVDIEGLTAALNANEETCGITPERGLFTDPLQVSFISLGLWPRRCGGYQFVPHPARQLHKLFATITEIPQRHMVAYATALSEAFWPVYWGWPMMMRFLKMHWVKTRPYQLEPWYRNTLTLAPRDVDWVRGFICKYNLPFVATHFEFDTGLFQRHPLVDHMLRFEAADPSVRSNLAKEFRVKF